MRLAYLRHALRPSPFTAVVVNDLAVDVSHTLATPVDSFALDQPARQDLMERANEAACHREDGVVPLAETVFLPPVPRPGKIVAVGLNYRDHAAEQGKTPPAAPVVFAKYASALTGHESPIVLPPNSREVDYEAELAVVIGRPARQIAREAAYDYVGGYTLLNDVSARDMQRQDKQFTRAKSCDTFAPMGPWLVTADEIPAPHALDIRLTLNGQVMQSSSTREMIFDIPYLIWFLSQSMTLEPGDVISTGTPGGVGVFRQPPVFLKPGDEVAVTIEALGTLKNHVVAAAVA
ncbi:MAG: fumarylacetoacetate hydrolase family protein [Chloracidobacterium sp.]|uniref:Fumarylacetoacetate hydrolase family protein n=1 Tax=Chloracidobacterium validum TaxID=2821543 RepID=A0ABX8B7Q6_9BACT|nr:fumarylacetoacetate hydrolase family protein [Chloracidobacterium validum]QUW02994.1 fumarylacetoacetate hydrolase family protein [Chloracidobacterium validum]